MKFLESFFFAPLVLTIATSGSAQIIYPPGYINMNIQSGGLVVPINNYLSKNEDDREQFISDQWNQGTIALLSGDSIKRYPLRYNLATEALEVKAGQSVKVVPLKNVRSFHWFEGGQQLNFINGSGYATESDPRAGYFQVLAEGDINLFKKAQLSVQKANYRPELDVGSPEDRTVTKEAFYLTLGERVVELENRKKVYHFFKQNQAEVKKFAKQQGWNPKREEDLVAIVNCYNELTK